VFRTFNEEEYDSPEESDEEEEDNKELRIQSQQLGWDGCKVTWLFGRANIINYPCPLLFYTKTCFFYLS